MKCSLCNDTGWLHGAQCEPSKKHPTGWKSEKCKCNSYPSAEPTNAAATEGTLGSVNQAGSTPAPVVAAPDSQDAELCKRCQHVMHVPPELEPTEYCNTCAQEIIVEQADRIAALTAERDRAKSLLATEHHCYKMSTQAHQKALQMRNEERGRAEKAEQRVATLEAEFQFWKDDQPCLCVRDGDDGSVTVLCDWHRKHYKQFSEAEREGHVSVPAEPTEEWIDRYRTIMRLANRENACRHIKAMLAAAATKGTHNE